MSKKTLSGAAPRLWDGLRTSAAAAIVSQCVQMACGVMVLRWVPPEQMGIWMALQAVEAYALFIRLGVLNAMNREYPYLSGKGKTEEALLAVQATAVYIGGCTALFLAGFGISGIVLASRGPDWQLAAMAFAVYSSGSIWRNFLEGTFRGGHEFKRLSILQLAGTALHVLTVPMVMSFGFSGYCVRAAVISVITTGLLHIFRPVRRIWAFECRMLPKLLREGLPLFGSNYLASLSAQFPRIALLAFGGAGILGLYAPVAALLSAGLMVPTALLSYLLPVQNFEYGRGSDRSTVVKRAWRQAITVSGVMLPVGIAGWWVIVQLVPHVLPKYIASLPALGYAVGSFVLSPLRMVTSVFSTFKAWWPMMIHSFLGIAINAASLWLIIVARPGETLVAVAQGTVIAQLVHALAAWPCLNWASRERDDAAVVTEVIAVAGQEPALPQGN